MRRRLGRSIPIFTLALLVQLLAPIGAFRVIAIALTDPTAVALTCAAMARQTDPAGSLPPSHGDNACCAICAVGLGNAPLPPPVPQAFALWERSYQRLSWVSAAEVVVARRGGLLAQARAPPSDVVI